MHQLVTLNKNTYSAQKMMSIKERECNCLTANTYSSIDAPFCPSSTETAVEELKKVFILCS